MERIYSWPVIRTLDKETFKWVTQDPFSVHLFESVSQFYGKVKSVKYNGYDDSLCAGLPHFATGFMRCWGRDTFIAFKGLLLVPGYHKEARDTILYFAKVTRHGLIPNLHDTGKSTRFNARDATWFFLQSIKDYVNMSSEGVEFLNESFELEFFSDDHIEHSKAVKANKPKLTMTISKLIQHILQMHAQGIKFREWNAGIKIDEHMKDQGFEIKIKLDPSTGIIYGGNKFNWGTWMDKMGSATENKGLPASPRDGAPIEITALWYSVITWLKELNEQGLFKYDGVRVTEELHYSYETWSGVLKDSFERWYWIPNDPTEDFMYCCNTEMVNERGIYKDVLKSSEEWRCYQFRPNQAVAMAVAPDLFTKKFARIALERISRYLIVPNQSLGIKTLSKSDFAYKGNYDNSDDTHGWNYHNGPEWVWPMGYYLIARNIFFEKSNQNIMKYLIPHQKQFFKSPWMSLPELTNEAGSYCFDSCPAQAWSIASIIDCVHQMLN